MGLGGAVQAQQLGQIGTGVQVTLGSLADEVSLTAKGHHVYLAEGLPLVRGGEQHFHGRHTAQPQIAASRPVRISLSCRMVEYNSAALLA